MSDIADFAESEQALARVAPKERDGHEVKFKVVDAEIRSARQIAH